MSETLTIELGKLGLSFSKSKVKSFDRWSHNWFFQNASDHDSQPILTSTEGTPEDDWPACPPMQDVSRHELESGGAILGVGMAGKSHWSASYSIEAVGESHFIKSDLACLQKQIAPRCGDSFQFGSTYELSSDWEVDSFEATKIVLHSAGIEFNAIIKAFTSEGCSTTFKIANRVITIEPNQISPSPVLATRWGFEISLAEISG